VFWMSRRGIIDAAGVVEDNHGKTKKRKR
jgi:hypothetical protein